MRKGVEQTISGENMPLVIKVSSRTDIIRIVAIYSVFGGLWIYLSDTFLGLLIRAISLPYEGRLGFS